MIDVTSQSKVDHYQLPQTMKRTFIIALKTTGAILGAIVAITIIMHLTGIMAQASFIYNLWWAKCAAIIGLALWETGTIVTKMDQQKLSQRNGIIAIALMSLSALTATAFFITGVGKWIFYLSFALFIVGTTISEGSKDNPPVTQ